ncbi:MAG: hypothetical protein DRP45_09580 [Candidatus Zixiibacteriota bacterium]|nr:MAG: hypothetical protein DRP45_09580 [candidate division Zixibacteria bacterium]
MEADFPYVASDASCNCPYEHPYTIESWAFVGGGSGIPSVEAIKQAIVDYGPVSVAVYANTAMQAYGGGVFNGCQIATCNHAVTLVGWDDSQGPGGVWFMRNSWGTGWGENGGYMRMPYGCSNIGYAACYVNYVPPSLLGFDYPGGTPSTFTPGEAATFDVIVSGINGGTSISGTGQLHYSLNGGAIQTDWMTENTPDNYTATLPALNCGDLVEYYVSAEEVSDGRLYDPDPASPYRGRPATGSPMIIFEDDFETDKGWSTEGQWERGTPTGSGGEYGNTDPSGAHSGSNEYGYNLNGDYPNDLPERHLTSPAIDCSQRINTHLKFWRWLGVEQRIYDHAYIRVSNNGTSWTTVWENSLEIADNSWTEAEVDISAVADDQSTVYVRFTMGSTDGGWMYCGWNIDDLQLTAHQCNGDPDGDGVLDSQDNCPNDYNPDQVDVDQDGFGAACDCDDTDENLNPSTVWYQDSDGDTFGNPAVSLTQCEQPVGYVLDNADCDDTNGNMTPNTIWYLDYDGDGYGDPSRTTITLCYRTPGYVLVQPDNCPDVYNPEQEDSDGDGEGDACQGCCIPPTVGDLDQSGQQTPFNVDGADLSLMIERLFISMDWTGICLEEADIDFSGQPEPSEVDIDGADLSLLIDALFISPKSLGQCP